MPKISQPLVNNMHAKAKFKICTFEKLLFSLVNGAIKCPFCVEKQEELEYDIQHQPSEVEKNIKSEEQIIFKPPVKMK